MPVQSDTRLVLVLHSGGLDSTVCLYQAISEGHRVMSLGIDYGQSHHVELEYARRQCAELGVPRIVIEVEWEKPKRDLPLDRDLEEMAQMVSSAFLPGRNAVFLSIACAEAAGRGASEVWIGINQIDFSGYPDCTQEFLDSFVTMINVAIPNAPGIKAPLMSLTKPEIALEAVRLGIKQDDTWSCYRPQTRDRRSVPCGRCDACLLHRHAWEGMERLATQPIDQR
ncbi:MAG: 7-cyano-7-deazaguanine synthase QueC [Nitrososphaera sp.]|nr:7-cyano-7-deazaguanine synthase QueC [Nitrososphaera sp.]